MDTSTARRAIVMGIRHLAAHALGAVLAAIVIVVVLWFALTELTTFFPWLRSV